MVRPHSVWYSVTAAQTGTEVKASITLMLRVKAHFLKWAFPKHRRTCASHFICVYKAGYWGRHKCTQKQGQVVLQNLKYTHLGAEQSRETNLYSFPLPIAQVQILLLDVSFVAFLYQ